jgi:RNA polymerase sigma-70 factor (ECF subfamily)
LNDRQHRGDGANEALLASIYRRHSAAVLAYALRRCAPDDAADVASETFVVAWRRIADVPDEPGVRPWLFGVARRVLANQRRGIRRRGALVSRVAAHLTPHLETIPAIEHHADSQLVLDALSRLSPPDRELLILSAWEQLTPAEIAVVLGISSSAARKRLFRARRRLAKVLDELEEPVPTAERSADSGHVDGRERVPRWEPACPDPGSQRKWR